MSAIQVNDIFEELIEENKRLNNELIFANKCINVLIGLKDHLMHVLGTEDITDTSADYKVIFPADVIKLKNFYREFDEVVNHCPDRQEVSETNGQIDGQNDMNNGTEPEVTPSEPQTNGQHYETVLVPKTEVSEEIESNIENIDTSHQMTNGSESSDLKVDEPIPQVKRITRSTSGQWSVLRQSGHSQSPTRGETVRPLRIQKKPINGSVVNRKVLKTKRDLVVKQYRKIGEKYQCPVTACDFASSHPSNLKVHLTKHTSERPYVCKVTGCDKRFKTLYRLQFHNKNVHTSERNYKCDVDDCGKAFKSRMSLKQHQLLHSTLKYVCQWPGCCYKTPFLSNIRNHNLKHTTERKFLCEWPQCSKKFKSKQYLALHMKKHQKGSKRATIASVEPKTESMV